MTPTPNQNSAPPRGSQSLLSFPASAWRSGIFQGYRALLASSTEASDAFLWGALAAALSVLVARTVTLPWGPGVIVATLFVTLVGKTGRARKSSAIDDVIDTIVMPLQSATADDGQLEIVTGSGSGEGFCEALADRWITVTDANGEKKRERQTERAAFFAIHELAGLLAKVSRNQAGNMLDFLLACFDARKIWSHRTRGKASGGSLTMTGATGVVLAASTEEWLIANLSDTHVLAGLANRVLWLSGERKAPIAIRPAVNVGSIAAFQLLVEITLKRMRGKTLDLDPAAVAAHEARYSREYNRTYDSDTSSAATARGDQIALRIAMLFAIADASTTITADMICAAWDVVEYSNATAEHLVARLHESTVREAEQRVLAAAQRQMAEKGSFTQRDIRQRVKGKTGMSAETFLRSWDALVAAGDILRDQNGAFRVS